MQSRFKYFMIGYLLRMARTRSLSGRAEGGATCQATRLPFRLPWVVMMRRSQNGWSRVRRQDVGKRPRNKINDPQKS